MKEDNPYSLTGETAMITGGGTGIGLGIADCMLKAGAEKVILVGRREEVLSEAVAGLGSRASYVVHDITDIDRIEDFRDRVAAEHGVPTCLVHNAGVNVRKPSVEMSDAEFMSVFDVHVRGSLAINRVFVPAMLEKRSGSILLIGSMAALMGLPDVSAYSIAKSAMHGMVYSLTAEYAPQGVRVNAILPGWIESKMALDAFKADPKRREKVFGRTPMDRLGRAEEGGHAAVFLASPAASFVTGALLTVDGGASTGF